MRGNLFVAVVAACRLAVAIPLDSETGSHHAAARQLADADLDWIPGNTERIYGAIWEQAPGSTVFEGEGGEDVDIEARSFARPIGDNAELYAIPPAELRSFDPALTLRRPSTSPASDTSSPASSAPPLHLVTTTDDWAACLGLADLPIDLTVYTSRSDSDKAQSQLMRWTKYASDINTLNAATQAKLQYLSYQFNALYGSIHDLLGSVKDAITSAKLGAREGAGAVLSGRKPPAVAATSGGVDGTPSASALDTAAAVGGLMDSVIGKQMTQIQNLLLSLQRCGRDLSTATDAQKQAMFAVGVDLRPRPGKRSWWCFWPGCGGGGERTHMPDDTIIRKHTGMERFKRDIAARDVDCTKVEEKAKPWCGSGGRWRVGGRD